MIKNTRLEETLQSWKNNDIIFDVLRAYKSWNNKEEKQVFPLLVSTNVFTCSAI